MLCWNLYYPRNSIQYTSTQEATAEVTLSTPNIASLSGLIYKDNNKFTESYPLTLTHIVILVLSPSIFHLFLKKNLNSDDIQSVLELG